MYREEGIASSGKYLIGLPGREGWHVTALEYSWLQFEPA
jgi:hypothetical protein